MRAGISLMGSVMFLTAGVLVVLAEFVLNDFNVSFWTGLIAGCLIGVGYEQLVGADKEEGKLCEVPSSDAGHHESVRARLPPTQRMGDYMSEPHFRADEAPHAPKSSPFR